MNAKECRVADIMHPYAGERSAFMCGVCRKKFFFSDAGSVGWLVHEEEKRAAYEDADACCRGREHISHVYLGPII